MIRILFLVSLLIVNRSASADDVTTLDLYPQGVPQWDAPTEPEHDATTSGGRAIGGRSVIRLTNVTRPQLHVMHPENGPGETIVVVCPGGGFRALAWDLEGIEIARRLCDMGVSAAVLKYRVPTTNLPSRQEIPVADLNQAILIVQAGQAGAKFERLGVMGFSAGANAIAHAIYGEHPIESVDFGVLVYPAYMMDADDSTKLSRTFIVDKNSPPGFFVHAANDRHSVLGSTLLHGELFRHSVPAEVHVFATGGHGFGGRRNDQPTDVWPTLLKSWMLTSGYVSSSETAGPAETPPSTKTLTR